jgi:hypothetical protein
VFAMSRDQQRDGGSVRLEQSRGTESGVSMLRFFGCASGLFVLFLSVPHQGSARQEHVDLRGAPVAAFCRLSDGNSATHSTVLGRVVCQRVSGALSCDSREGQLEPADFELADVCRRGSFRLNRAERIPVASSGRNGIDVDWLRIAPDGQVTRLATRSFDSPKFVLSVAKNLRLLRFRGPGFSPLTIDLPSLSADGIVLPITRPGGEFVGLVEASRVQPSSLRLLGPTQVELDRRDRSVVTSQGLFAGSYSVVPVYRGGLIGEPIAFEIASDQSTFVLLKAANVGELRASVPGENCNRDFELRVVRTETGELRNSIIESEIARVTDDGQCRWAVAGLKPGAYRVEVALHGRPYGRSPVVSVEPQRVSIARLEWASARVSGQVRLHTAPLAGAELEFTPEGSPLPGSSTTTAPDGRFAILLQTPGRYNVQLRHPDTAKNTRDLQINAGDNFFDWALYGGTLTIRIEGAVGNAPVTIHMDSRRTSSPDSIERGTSSSIVVTRQGLEFGTYHISAEQEDGLQSGIKQVVISRDKPHAAVTLLLRSTSALLTLTDHAGRPIRDAAVLPLLPSNPFIVARPRLKERDPGVFDLTGLSPGMSLLIRVDGFASGCRLVPADGAVNMVLDTGRAVHFQLPTSVSFTMIRAFTIEGIPNSDCPIPLTQFRPSFDEQSGMVRMTNFPSIERVVFRNTGARYDAIVPSVGQLILERR